MWSNSVRRRRHVWLASLLMEISFETECTLQFAFQFLTGTKIYSNWFKKISVMNRRFPKDNSTIRRWGIFREKSVEKWNKSVDFGCDKHVGLKVPPQRAVTCQLVSLFRFFRQHHPSLVLLGFLGLIRSWIAWIVSYSLLCSVFVSFGYWAVFFSACTIHFGFCFWVVRHGFGVFWCVSCV